MKTDFFTKCILTVIALLLFWIAINLTPTATASRQIIDVNIIQVSDKYIEDAVPVVTK